MDATRSDVGQRNFVCLIEIINPDRHNLAANTPKTNTFQLRIRETGQFKMPVQLTISTDRTDYEQVERVVVLVVRENDGEYFII